MYEQEKKLLIIIQYFSECDDVIMETIIEETSTAEETQQTEEINFASSSTSLTPELARLGAPLPVQVIVISDLVLNFSEQTYF